MQILGQRQLKMTLQYRDTSDKLADPGTGTGVEIKNYGAQAHITTLLYQINVYGPLQG